MAENDDATQYRYFRIPKNQKEVPGWDFVKWLIWYTENEERLKADHAKSRIIGRIGDAIEGLKPATDEVDAIKDAEANVARHKAELEAAERALEVLKAGPPPKPVPAYPGDIAKIRDSDWKFVIGLLTNEKEAPKCGYGQPNYIQVGDKVVRIDFPMRPVLRWIDALNAATLTPPEESPKAEAGSANGIAAAAEAAAE